MRARASAGRPAAMPCGSGPPHLLRRRVSRSGTFRVASSIKMPRTGAPIFCSRVSETGPEQSLQSRPAANGESKLDVCVLDLRVFFERVERLVASDARLFVAAEGGG